MLPIGVQQVLDSLSAPEVTIFVRHSPDCKHKDDESYRECRCRKHLRWSENGKQYRQSTGLRSWEAAEKAKSSLEEELTNRMRQRKPMEQTVRVLQPSPVELAKSLVWEDAKRPPEEMARVLKVLENGNRDLRLMESEFFTTAEIAKILKVCEKTVIRRFADFPGVIDIGTEETRYKRRYRVLRIPGQVFQKFLIANRIGH